MCKTYLTKEGLTKLKEELKTLIEIKRPEIASKIKEARDMGNLLENLVYDSALEEQGMTEARIKEISDTLANAEVAKDNKSGIVQVGSTIDVTCNGTKMIFKVVNGIEADPLRNLISADSPVGQALIGKKAGETVEIKTTSFKVIYKIISIE